MYVCTVGGMQVEVVVRWDCRVPQLVKLKLTDPETGSCLRSEITRALESSYVSRDAESPSTSEKRKGFVLPRYGLHRSSLRALVGRGTGMQWLYDAAWAERMRTPTYI